MTNPGSDTSRTSQDNSQRPRAQRTDSQRSFGWSIHGDGKRVLPGAVVAPDERLSWPRTIGIGMQHVVAMFGATLLVPTLTGFPVKIGRAHV